MQPTLNEYRHRTTDSDRVFQTASRVIPGGVSHNVRYAAPYPIAIERADGAVMVDVDGNEYVDFWNNHGAGILGHAHPDVVDAVTDQLERGIHYGAVNEPTVELADRIGEFVPSAERVRFCCSGTEATMFAVRLARAVTGRDRILKVEGGWHGGNTTLTHSVHPPFEHPSTAGLPPGIAESVHSFRLNDQAMVTDLLERYRGEIAGVILDPRRSGISPTAEFIGFLDDARDEHGFHLIFDEVVSGFRFSPGSYQARVGVTPDSTTLGKILGGGFPIGAVCGRAEVFESTRPDRVVDPAHRVIAGGGTFSSHPTVATAGLATLQHLADTSVLQSIETTAETLRTAVQSVFDDAGINARVLGDSSLIQFAFEPDRDLQSPSDFALATDHEMRHRFQRGLLEHGFFFNPGSIGNLSSRITDAHVEAFVQATQHVIDDMLTSAQSS